MAYTSNGYTFKDNYTTDELTDAMKYAIAQTGADPNAPKAADKYVEDMLGRVGTQSANTGNTLTLGDIQSELSRLGFNVSGGANSPQASYTKVGGQEYLTGGNDYNRLQESLANAGKANTNIYNGKYLAGLNPYGNGNNYMNAYERALANSLNNIDARKKAADEDSAKQQAQAYTKWMLSQKALRNQLAASGLNDTGYSETSNVNLASVYGNDLQNIAAQNAANQLQLDQLRTDTALNGAYTQAQLERQAQLDKLSQQQQAVENARYEQQYADAQAQQQLAQAKVRADAAMNMGYWTQDVQDYYGITKQQFDNAMNKIVAQQANTSASGSSNKASSGNQKSDYGNAGYRENTQEQRLQAIGEYADQRLLRQIAGQYGITLDGAQQIIDIANKYGKTIDQVYKDMANL